LSDAEQVLDTIPKGSDIVFLFGEIDCREGILLAVEKGRYEDLEEGITVCVNIFRDALREVGGDVNKQSCHGFMFSSSVFLYVLLCRSSRSTASTSTSTPSYLC
jgi:hypothetical protein